MSAAYGRYVSLLLFFLLLLSGCHAWEGMDKDKSLIMTLCQDLVIDMVRKGNTVWNYRMIYSQFVSFAMGERIYLIRARFAAQLRTHLRTRLDLKTIRLNEMVMQTLQLQRRTQGIYILSDELKELDRTINTVDNPTNTTRFIKPNCQVTGPQCDIIPMSSGYRRHFGTMDEALKQIDARRRFIEKTYYPKKKPAIDIAAEVKRSLNFKYTTLSGSETPDTNTDFLNLAPDFMN